MTDDLPALPDGYFFRISAGWFFGPTVRVQLRRRPRYWPMSVRRDSGWSTREIMKVGSDREVALCVARALAHRLECELRPIDLGDLEGDHR